MSRPDALFISLRGRGVPVPEVGVKMISYLPVSGPAGRFPMSGIVIPKRGIGRRPPLSPLQRLAIVADMQHCRQNITHIVSILHNVSEPRHRFGEGEATDPDPARGEPEFDPKRQPINYRSYSDDDDEWQSLS
jgi:hypothetical protein